LPSRPSHAALHDFVLDTLKTKSSITDFAYAITFICLLGLSAIGLLLNWYRCKDPIFPKETIKLPRFRFHNYDSLPTHVENGNGVGHKKQKIVRIEPLKGWRMRMGVLHTAVLLALTIVHTLILIADGPSFLRIVFIVYWVFTFSSDAYIRAFCSLTWHSAHFRLHIEGLCTARCAFWGFFH
jgi:hypothetical protein